MNYLTNKGNTTVNVMGNSFIANQIFNEAIEDYHKINDINGVMSNPYSPDSLQYLLYQKCWIDTVQWHLEDEIRDIEINSLQCLEIKRKIDISNQKRTDVVENIDDYFLLEYQNTVPVTGAKINTESPAWAIDRLSILALKIYHMQIEVNRDEASAEHRNLCQRKLEILLEQRKDLCVSIDELHNDIINGVKLMKVYRQLKMYNDPALNPVLYKNISKNNLTV